MCVCVCVYVNCRDRRLIDIDNNVRAHRADFMRSSTNARACVRIDGLSDAAAAAAVVATDRYYKRRGAVEIERRALYCVVVIAAAAAAAYLVLNITEFLHYPVSPANNSFVRYERRRVRTATVKNVILSRRIRRQNAGGGGADIFPVQRISNPPIHNLFRSRNLKKESYSNRFCAS